MNAKRKAGPRWGLEARLAGVLVVLVVVLAVLGMIRLWAAPVSQVAEPTPESSVEPLVPSPPVSQSAAEEDTVIVYVTGAVSTPGVFELREGDRVIDAVTAAGGPTDQAALESVNLARPVVDGEQINLPQVGETPTDVPAEASPPGAENASGCVDLNQADAAQLETLDGIGPTLAQRIIAHRETEGPFAGKEALQEVSGIGPKIYAGLEGQLCG